MARLGGFEKGKPAIHLPWLAHEPLQRTVVFSRGLPLQTTIIYVLVSLEDVFLHRPCWNLLTVQRALIED